MLTKVFDYYYSNSFLFLISSGQFSFVLLRKQETWFCMVEDRRRTKGVGKVSNSQRSKKLTLDRLLNSNTNAIILQILQNITLLVSELNHIFALDY
jgi:hypothetical protein